MKPQAFYRVLAALRGRNAWLLVTSRIRLEGGLPHQALVGKELLPLPEEEAARWIIQTPLDGGGNMRPDQARQLVAACGCNALLLNLCKELLASNGLQVWPAPWCSRQTLQLLWHLVIQMIYTPHVRPPAK